MIQPIHINFIPRKSKKRDDGKVPLYMRITVNGERAELSASRTIDPKNWDTKKDRLKGRTSTAKEVNTHLNILENKARNAHTALIQKEEEITAKKIRLHMRGEDNKKETKPVLEVFELHNSRMKSLIGNKYAESTYKKHKTCKLHMENFLDKEFTRKYPINKVDLNFLEEFADYLMTKKDSCSNNSARKYLTNFKKVIDLARKRKWLNDNPYEDFDMKYEKKDPVFLADDELKKLKKGEMPNESLERVKDVFLFSCYTGLSFSDAKKMKQSDIREDSDGERYLQLPRTKTEKNAVILLLPKAEEIIEKYKDDPATENGSLLPMISNQKTNAYLKVVADICDIDKNLTFHVGRHTFATTVALANGVPVETVKHILGHSDIRSTLHYARVTPNKVTKDMTLLREKLG